MQEMLVNLEGHSHLRKGGIWKETPSKDKRRGARKWAGNKACREQTGPDRVLEIV